MKQIFFLLAVFGLVMFVMLDSGALEFRREVLQTNDLIERQSYKPDFSMDRLPSYFNKIVHKIRNSVQ